MPKDYEHFKEDVRRKLRFFVKQSFPMKSGAEINTIVANLIVNLERTFKDYGLDCKLR